MLEILITACVLTQVITPLLWFVAIRPFIRKGQGYSASGANWFITMFIDHSKAWSIAKENAHKPWYLYLYSLILYLPIVIFVVALVGVIVVEGMK